MKIESRRAIHPRAEGVNKAFDGFKAITDLNFYLDEGELRTVIGPNGAGKSTMLDLITGRTKPDKGKIEFGRDTDLTAERIPDQPARHRAEIPDALGLHRSHRLRKLLLSLEGSRGVWRRLFRATTPAGRDRIDDILKTVGLAEKARVEGRRARPRPEAMAGDRHAARAEPEAAARGRTRRRHDRRGNAQDRRTAAQARRQAQHLVIEHDMTFVRQIAGARSPCCTKAPSSAKARWTKCRITNG